MPIVDWSVQNDCSDLGAITAAVFFGSDKLYESAATPIAPLGKAGEQVALTIPPSAAAGLWKFGQHVLELRVTSPGAPGKTFKTTSQFQVEPNFPWSLWDWGPPSPPALFGPVPWHQTYTVAGRLFNSRSSVAWTPSVTINETTDEPGVSAAGAIPANASGTLPVAPGDSTNVDIERFHAWTWIDPLTFQTTGPLTARFTYVATYTLTDQFGNVTRPRPQRIPRRRPFRTLST